MISMAFPRMVPTRALLKLYHLDAAVQGTPDTSYALVGTDYVPASDLPVLRATVLK